MVVVHKQAATGRQVLWVSVHLRDVHPVQHHLVPSAAAPVSAVDRLHSDSEAEQ